jgi:hypothetical protein
MQYRVARAAVAIAREQFGLCRRTQYGPLLFVARFSGSLSWFGCARRGGGAVYKKAGFCRNHHCLNVPAARLGSATRQHPYWAPKYRTDCHVHRSRGYRITPHAEQDLFCCLQWRVMRTHQPGHRRRFHAKAYRATCAIIIVFLFVSLNTEHNSAICFRSVFLATGSTASCADGGKSARATASHKELGYA